MKQHLLDMGKYMFYVYLKKKGIEVTKDMKFSKDNISIYKKKIINVLINNVEALET